MPRAITLQGDLFADVLTKIDSLSVSQQRFIHEMLAGAAARPGMRKKSVLKKSFGLWADRDDITDSVEYVNNLRKGWNTNSRRDLRGF